MSKLIVVIGVTGMQGGSVARTFVSLPEWRVRGITRNPSGEAAKELETAGVEIVQGDLDDKASLARAFEGATAIFANTDFFLHLYHAMTPGSLPEGNHPLRYAYDREVEQNLNIAEAAAAPGVISTLERFIFSSLSEARKWSGGKYTSVYHFDSKAEALRQIHAKFPAVAARLSKLQLGHYVTNWRSFARLGPQKQADGSYVMVRDTPADFRMPHVVTHRDTGEFVKALLALPPGKELLAVSEWMTFPEWVAVWARVLGVQATYRQVTREALFEGVPKPMADELGDGFNYIHEFGFTGGDPDVLDPAQLDFKIPVTSMEEYIRSEDWSPLLNPST